MTNPANPNKPLPLREGIKNAKERLNKIDSLILGLPIDTDPETREQLTALKSEVENLIKSIT